MKTIPIKQIVVILNYILGIGLSLGVVVAWGTTSQIKDSYKRLENEFKYFNEELSKLEIEEISELTVSEIEYLESLLVKKESILVLPGHNLNSVNKINKNGTITIIFDKHVFDNSLPLKKDYAKSISELFLGNFEEKYSINSFFTEDIDGLELSNTLSKDYIDRLNHLTIYPNWYIVQQDNTSKKRLNIWWVDHKHNNKLHTNIPYNYDAPDSLRLNDSNTRSQLWIHEEYIRQLTYINKDIISLKNSVNMNMVESLNQ